MYKSKTAVERFYSKYHTRTEEDMKALKEVYDKEVTEKVNSENSEAVTTAIGMDYQYIKVDEIGDAAVWEHKVNDLEVAKQIAQAIIEKACH